MRGGWFIYKPDLITLFQPYTKQSMQKINNVAKMPQSKSSEIYSQI